MILPPSLLKAISQLEIQSQKRLVAFCSGAHHSSFRGTGMQFKEFRHYEPGDDIRHMSWPVTARTKRPTIKIYEEERELNILLAVDVSSSTSFSQFSIPNVTRKAMYAEIFAILGLGTIETGNRFASLFFADSVEKIFPPSQSRHSVFHSLTQFLSYSLERKKTNFPELVSFLGRTIKKRVMLILLTDLLFPYSEKELACLAKKHELIVLHCQDGIERGIGFSGIYPIWDPELDDFFLIDGNSLSTQKILSQDHQTRCTIMARQLKTLGAEYCFLDMQEDYVAHLVHFFKNRRTSR